MNQLKVPVEELLGIHTVFMLRLLLRHETHSAGKSIAEMFAQLDQRPAIYFFFV